MWTFSFINDDPVVTEFDLKPSTDPIDHLPAVETSDNIGLVFKTEHHFYHHHDSDHGCRVDSLEIGLEGNSKPIDALLSRQATTTSLKRKLDLYASDANVALLEQKLEPGSKRAYTSRLDASPPPRNVCSSTSRSANLDAEPVRPPNNPGEAVSRHAQSITTDDLDRLNPGYFLNDNIIEFALIIWLGNLQQSSPDLANEIHVFSSFFYKKLISDQNLEVGYQSVRKWTNKLDIFEKKYLIIPINEDLHWYLAIIYEPEHVVKGGTPTQSRIRGKDEEQDEFETVAKTYIFIFDSLGRAHPRTTKKLSGYLMMEAKEKRHVKHTGIIEVKTPKTDFQTNSCDCGVYLLHFAETFMSNPAKYTSIILQEQQTDFPLAHADHKLLWLVNEDFETVQRQRLRSRVEDALPRNREQLRAEVENETDESDVEVIA